MSLNPVIARPVDFIGSTLVKADLATESEVNALKGLAGYAKRDGFLGSIATVLHRVWNAVKAVFGQSDWQRAERALISFAERNIAKLSRTDEELEEGKRLIAEMRSKEGHEKINELFELGIGFIGQANEKVKPYETFALPLVEALIAAINQEAVVEALKQDPIKTLESFDASNPVGLLKNAADKGFVDTARLEDVMTRNPQIVNFLG